MHAKSIIYKCHPLNRYLQLLGPRAKYRIYLKLNNKPALIWKKTKAAEMLITQLGQAESDQHLAKQKNFFDKYRSNMANI